MICMATATRSFPLVSRGWRNMTDERAAPVPSWPSLVNLECYMLSNIHTCRCVWYIAKYKYISASISNVLLNVLFIMYIVYYTVFCSRSALTIISQFIYPPKQPPAQEPHRLRNSGIDMPGLEFKDITGQTYFCLVPINSFLESLTTFFLYWWW